MSYNKIEVKLTKKSWRLLSQQISIIFDCLRGVVYYRKMRSGIGNLKNSNNNVLRFTYSSYHDVAINSWCMLFGTNSNPTHWKKLFDIDEIKESLKKIGLTDQNVFRETMLTQLEINKKRYEYFHNSCLDYRNRSLSHREHDPKKISDSDLQIPILYIPYKTATFLYDTIAKITKNIGDASINQSKYEFSFYNKQQLMDMLNNEADNLVKALSKLL